jgi:heptosyltransferase-2
VRAPARVIVRAPNWLGDAVMAIPAMAAVRRHFADATLTIAASPALAGLFRERLSAAPDAVLELPARRRDEGDAVRAGHFDLAILLPNSLGSAWQMRKARVPDRWGYAAAGRRWLLTRAVGRPSRRVTRHQADYYRELVRRLGIDCSGEPPRVDVSESSAIRAAALLATAGVPGGAPLVALLPGAAYGQAKQWPPARVAELAVRLARERGAWSVLLGSSHDRPAARAIESWLSAHAPDAASYVVDLVDRTSLGALAGVLGRAVLCVTNDSGGMHLASAVGCPVVAIFGPTDERATRPCGDHDLMTASAFCRPCLLRDCPIDHRCMKRISVDHVAMAAFARLDRAAPA